MQQDSRMTTHAAPMPLTRSSVLVVVLLTLVTLGLYLGIWYLLRRRQLNSLDSSSRLLLVEPILLVALIAVYLATLGSSLERLLGLAVSLTNVIMAFKVRWMLVEHLSRQVAAALPQQTSLVAQYKPSSLLTFFLNIFYLQYKINEMIHLNDILRADLTADGQAT